MKKYVWLYAITIIMLLAGITLGTSINRITPVHEIDYSEINRIVTYANTPENLIEHNFAYRFVIINDNKVVYKSHNSLAEDSILLIKQGFLPMDINSGKVYIETLQVNRLMQMNKRLSWVIITAFVLLCGLNLIFVLTLHSKLIKPFKRLEFFAYKISTGNFDEPLPMDKSNTFGLFTQSFDIMRESLIDANRSRHKIERKQKELIASLSHDIKTPVTSIQLMTEFLQAINNSHGNDNHDIIAETLETIETKTIQIDRLINDLLNSALEELGELKVSVTTAESEVFRLIFQNNDPLSKVRIGSIPVCLIEIDILRMEQIVGNIITNSYKYADTYIDVDFKINGKYLQIDINDYGNGIQSEEVELIFTKFYRGENAKTSQREGEGLGLYISKMLMEKIGGGIEVFNRSDGFTVRISVCLSR